MFHTACRGDLSSCRKLEMIVWFVKYWRRLQTERFISFLLVTRFYAILLKRFSVFQNATLSKGNSFLFLGFARTPWDFDWLFFQTKLSCDHRPDPGPRLKVGLVLCNQVLQLTHVSQKRQRPYPSSCWTPQPIPSPFKSLELLFFAASKNITPWFFQVSSKICLFK